MDYYGILGLRKEPFSNSPDPDFFYRAEGHQECLHRLEIAIRLRRGLNIVLGEVGLGKTTICRQLLRNLDDKAIETHLILDPSFDSTRQLLRLLASELLDKNAPQTDSKWELKESIKNALFSKVVDEDKTVVLIVDEGQKISPDCLEVLRELLNYETNDAKLLQIIIFAQPEFTILLEQMQNVDDRINERITLMPLTLGETIQMVEHRIGLAKENYNGPVLFSGAAYTALHNITGGRPRKVMNLCHKVILSLIMQNRTTADAELVKACAKGLQTSKKKEVPRWAYAALVVLAIAIGAASFPALRNTALNISTKVNATRETALPQQSVSVVAQPVLATTALPIQKAEDVAQEILSTESEVDHAHRTTAPYAEPVRDFVPPRFLGSVPLPRKESLSVMMARIYGAYAAEDQRCMLEANAQIGNPNIISPGTLLRFPCMRIYAAEKLPPTYWVELTRAGTLREAYRALNKSCTNCRILPLYTAQDGLTFSIVKRRSFSSQKEASTAITHLPLRAQESARVLPGNTKGMRYLGGESLLRTLGEGHA